MEDEWQFVESPNDGAEEPADPHMSTPKPSPSPTPQNTNTELSDTFTETETETETEAETETKVETKAETETEEHVSEKVVGQETETLAESPKSKEPPPVTMIESTDVTAGKPDTYKYLYEHMYLFTDIIIIISRRTHPTKSLWITCHS